jgi:imidazolonepropionase-like amidohydrolase
LSGNDVADMTGYDGSGLAKKMLANANRQLEGGVLLLAEKGSSTSLTLQFLDVPEWRRPRMQMAGRMVAVAGGYYPGFAAEVDDADLDAVVADAASGGATWVKIVGDWPRKGRGAIRNFSEGALRQIVDKAHQAGCRVAIHAAAPDTPQLAVRAGVDSIEHGLFLHQEDLVALGERGGAWVPTIAAMEAVVAWLGADSSGGRLLADGLVNTAALVADAVDAGVAVLAGTDLALPHGKVAAEALRLAEYGLSPAQAVHAVGEAAYDYLGVEAGFRPGLSADAVLLAADPVGDLRLLLNPVVVMRAGVAIVGRLAS